MAKKKLFITFEGIEGCGKSTHAPLLSDHLKEKGFDVLLTLEPGGTRMGQALRQILLDRDSSLCRKTELLLFAADRMEHVSSVIKPALSEGKIVICDRFVDSTTAYQTGGSGLPAGTVEMLNDLTTDGLEPDVTVLFDLPVEASLKRISARPRDRFEKESDDFHGRVRDKFLEIAKKHPTRVRVVDSSGTIDDVQQKVRSVIEGYLK